AFFDGAIVGSIFGVMEGRLEGSFVPLMIKNIVFHDKLHDRCYCYSKLKKVKDEIISFDSYLCDESGVVLVEMEDVTLKRIRSFETVDQNIVNTVEVGEVQPVEQREAERVAVSKATDLQKAVRAYLYAKIQPLMGDSKKDFSDDRNFMDLGVDSSQLISLAQGIEHELNVDLYPTLFFEYQNLKELSGYFASEFKDILTKKFGGEIDGVQVQQKQTVTTPVPIYQEREDVEVPLYDEQLEGRKKEENDIAVIGMSGVFSQSNTLEQFWSNLKEKQDLIKEIPSDHFDFRPYFDPTPQAEDKMYCKWGSFIDNVDKFDASFFNISPREAERMDPQLRYLLQVLYWTAEDASYANRIRGSKTGMYVGVCFHDYAQEMDRSLQPVAPHDGTGNASTMLANRPSFYFDLRGPSLSVDTACSSSLVALHIARKALQNNECEMAFVAGVNLLLSSWHYRYFCSIGALSLTGRSHTFDARADGYVPGEGIAAILLKPLKKALRDGDNIHAIIKGSAINHGGYTPSVTAPSVKQEAQVMLDAWEDAGINPETLGYIEAHGTGTKLGDPIEINGLKEAFKHYTSKKNFCAIGSAKAHIGHLEGAAGIAGIIKVILSMKHRQIPAMPKFSELNPYIKLENSPLYINRELIDWTEENDLPRRAGVSSFGFGGAYAHVVLEDYKSEKSVSAETDVAQLVLLSAKDEVQLKEYVKSFVTFLEDSEKQVSALNLKSLAYSFQVGREIMEVKLAIVVDSIDEL
ncbi:MAG: beta-ketoacyl synthase N-terminal-like domain-containing protein, partial [Parcubacteria group bacterium]